MDINMVISTDMAITTDTGMDMEVKRLVKFQII